MTWTKKVAKKHNCSTPRYDEACSAGVGSVWKCDDCGQKWRLARTPTYGSLTFERLSRFNWLTP